MRKSSKLVLAALAAAGVLAAAVGAASATRLEFSNQGVRIVWEGLKVSNTNGGVEVICPVTLEGTLHSRTISKVSQSLIGQITRAIVNEALCQGGGYELLNGLAERPQTLPWHIRYVGFAGTLPTITDVGLFIVGFSVLMRANIFPMSCLYRSTAERPVIAIARINEAEEITVLRTAEEEAIPKAAGPVGCPAEARLANAGNVMLLGTTTRIRIRLVV